MVVVSAAVAAAALIAGGHGHMAIPAALVCLLPRVNLAPPERFRREASLAALIYVAGTLGVGAVVALPYRVGPIVFALMLGGARFGEAARLMAPLPAVSAAVLRPLPCPWWRALGYLG